MLVNPTPFYPATSFEPETGHLFEEFKKTLGGWLNGDFHRMTGRSERDLQSYAHHGFRLPRASQRVAHAGRSYLAAKLNLI